MEITENKLKEILIEQRQEFQRSTENALESNRKEYQHFMGIVKEELQTSIQVIGEQYQGIKDDIKTLKEDVSDIKDDVALMKNDIQSIKSSLKKKVDYDEFEELSRRVTLLESRSKK